MKLFEFLDHIMKHSYYYPPSPWERTTLVKITDGTYIFRAGEAYQFGTLRFEPKEDIYLTVSGKPPRGAEVTELDEYRLPKDQNKN